MKLLTHHVSTFITCVFDIITIFIYKMEYCDAIICFVKILLERAVYRVTNLMFVWCAHDCTVCEIKWCDERAFARYVIQRAFTCSYGTRFSVYNVWTRFGAYNVMNEVVNAPWSKLIRTNLMTYVHRLSCNCIYAVCHLRCMNSSAYWCT